MFTQAKLTTTKTSNELLIEFLEKRGLKQKAESLRNDATSLDLGHNQIEAEGAKVLADALKTNSSIASLDIGWNQIGDEGIRVFADALKINNSITLLDIGYSKIGDEGARLLADALNPDIA
ncbi:hypothetical protein [Rickettsia endosymbiont of Polydrusus tereticollis]|uniref:hypothetical protein n=1 Tax=Rickettsia endosymbiont of Polydrusus tereticollis TaxID=3066251 RepID=UPI0031330DB0